jgi:hypothetical protein
LLHEQAWKLVLASQIKAFPCQNRGYVNQQQAPDFARRGLPPCARSCGDGRTSAN